MRAASRSSSGRAAIDGECIGAHYGRRVPAPARFAQLVNRPEHEIALDEACFVIAAHAHPHIDVDARLAQLDAIASSIDGSDAGALAHALFVDLAFAGNTVDYGDPRNSYLDDVLD